MRERPGNHRLAEALEPRALLAATLVGDINPNDAGSSLSALTALNGKTIFVDTARGNLDVSDGTAAGTSVIQSGLNASSISFVVLGGTAYFENMANGSTTMWKTDGTAGGTQQVMVLPTYSYGLFTSNGSIYFTVLSAGNYQVWKSDGTSSGTTMVHQFSGITVAGAYVYYNGFTYFPGINGTNDDLWRTDGTDAGTTLVKEIATGSSGNLISNLSAVGGYLYFTATQSTTGREPWRSDGTSAGTILLGDLVPGSTGSYPTGFVTSPAGNTLFIANGYLYSTTGTTATRLNPSSGTAPYSCASLFAAGALDYFTGIAGEQLWQTNGTAVGTILTPVVNTASSFLHPGDFAVYGTGSSTRLFMTIADGASGGHRWLTGGTAATTVNIDIGVTGTNYVINGTSLTFVGNDPVYGSELYFADGTAAVPQLVVNLTTTPYSSDPNDAISFGGKYFAVATPASGLAQWYRSDGSTVTGIASNVATPSAYNAIEPYGSAWNGAYYYYGSGANSFYRLDGTSVTTLNSGIRWASSNPPYFTVYNNKLYFVAYSANDIAIYQTDGTASGTVPLTSLVYGSSSGMVSGGGYLYYEITDSTGHNIYRSDGTVAGTSAVINMTASLYQEFEDLTWFNNALYFTWRDTLGSTPTSLYKYTGAGAPVLISTSSGSSDNFPPQVVGNELLFSGGNGASYTGGDLWVSDGTSAGTHPIKASEPFGGYAITYINRTANRIFFSVADSQGINHLWVTNGTDAGTFPLNATIGGKQNTFTNQLLPDSTTVADGQLFFVSSDASTGTEVWKSDGTTAGTFMLTDINPGSANADPSAFGSAGSSVLFAATEPVHGTELWSVPATYGPEVVSTTISNTSISMAFSEDVGTSLSASSLQLQDLTTGQTVPGPLVMNYSSTTDTAVFTLPASLPADRYRVTLPAGSVSDSGGQSLASASITDFAFVPGTTATSNALITLAADGTTLNVFQSQASNGMPNSLVLSTSITGLSSVVISNGAYASQLTINASTGNPIPSGGVAFFGGTSANSVTLLGGAGNHVVAFSPSTVSYDAASVTLEVPAALSFDPGAGVDSAAITATTVLLATPTVGAGVAAKQFSTLSISSAALLTVPSIFKNGVLDRSDRYTVVCQSMIDNGSLDLGDNDLIVLNASGGSTVTTYSKLIGQSAAAGIFSSAAISDPSHLTTLGIRQSSGGTVDGQTTTASAIVLKYCYYGDANLDGQVDGSDYSLIDSGFLTHRSGWSNGDFNYDGLVDGSDYTLIDNAFNKQGASLAAQIAAGPQKAASHNSPPQSQAWTIDSGGGDPLAVERRKRKSHSVGKSPITLARFQDDLSIK